MISKRVDLAMMAALVVGSIEDDKELNDRVPYGNR